VTNRPVVANDPTGHYCVGDVEECMGNTEGRGGKRKSSNYDLSGNNDDTPPDLILACGLGAGANCDNTADYDGFLPLSPYYQLSTGMPLNYGVDLYANYGADSKLMVALAIYMQIKNNPGRYNLVGHSAGGTAVIIAARWLQRDGFGDRIANLILLDPAMDKNLQIDGKGTNIQDEANKLVSSGITVFLGDSPQDGDDYIAGAIRYPTTDLSYEVNHLQLATNTDIYNNIVNDTRWRP
jgi:hypothetical protein